MSHALSELASAVARDLAALTKLPVVISDGHGKTLARTGEAHVFCPLISRDESHAPPLPLRCEECERNEAVLAHDPDRLARCPYGIDKVRAIVVNGEIEGWIACAILPRSSRGSGSASETGSGPRRGETEVGCGEAVERAEAAFRLAELPLAAAIAADRRERSIRFILDEKLHTAAVHVAHALQPATARPEIRRELEAAKGMIEGARELLAAFRASPSAVAEAAAEAAHRSAPDAGAGSCG